MRPPIPRLLRDVGKRQINRAPSPNLALLTPWIVVMLGSLAPLMPLIASAPLVPPLGFLLLLGWLLLRPGIFPAWAGFPLGLFDDLFSGQPLGSSALLWSVAVLTLEIIEYRVPWRNFLFNWAIAAGLVSGHILLSALFAQAGGGGGNMIVLIPQLILAILLVPLVGRIVALFDRFRLLPIRDIG
jgi:rod shape-determining protein MreD